MEWTDLVVEVAKKDSETAADILTGFSDSGLYMEDYSDLEDRVFEMAHVDMIEPELLQKPRDLVLIHLYFAPGENPAIILEKIRSLFAAAGVQNRVLLSQVEQEDWENAWKKHYHAIEMGRRLLVAPSWEDCESDRIVLRLDPGMAFGTGTHETTALCLEALDEFVHGGETMLDIGTGSGILAVAGLLLGAQTAFGIDIDPMCVKTAMENAERNGVSRRFRVKSGDLAGNVGGRYDIITANIVADAILRLAPALSGLLAPEGLFVASGILAERAGEVQDALEAAGLRRAGLRQKNDWVALLFRPGEAG